jgi:hypothetical protein
MTSKIYGLKYLHYKVIPLKHLGQHISKRIAFSYSGLVPLAKTEQITEQTNDQKAEQTGPPSPQAALPRTPEQTP